MYYLIQENLYRDFHEEHLIDTLQKMDLDFELFKIIPFTEELKLKTNRKDIMVFGAVKASHLAKNYNWYPGSFYNENHDYTIYSKYYRENMLNWDSTIQKFGDPVNIDTDFFVRPTGDNKYFKGEIYSKENWDYFVNFSLANGHSNSLNYNTPIQICPYKEIYQEYRSFIVKGKVIETSMYKLGIRSIRKRCIDQEIIDFAQSMVDLYQISDAFVMDICRCESGLKIVECNCINSAGFYDIDMCKLIFSLEENFNI